MKRIEIENTETVEFSVQASLAAAAAADLASVDVLAIMAQQYGFFLEYVTERGVREGIVTVEDVAEFARRMMAEGRAMCVAARSDSDAEVRRASN